MRVRVISRIGDPFLSPHAPSADIGREHMEVLNSLFFDGSVDIGGVVEIDGTRYVCTASGWVREV
ncbi:MAG: hypothetical protein M1117_02315 [Candidatus Thermoplasmatota archaeon]|uniref:Uncharacterized protein n=1 Tax=Candidatus Sysuiplasma superficiale TaxID=2823368 RepID=A0A8J8CBE9_9ARCH|nr:hypothetical protein [Candidatus Sysuiplasma superficiale]MCL4346739.1 hypothetical protein [Candidatus Thermoplasmatota archaeon]